MAENQLSERLESNARVIEIDPTGKQILVLRGLEQDELVFVDHSIRGWLQTKSPILVIGLEHGAAIELVKVDKGGA